MRANIERKIRAENILAKITGGVGFSDGLVKDIQDVAVFTADVNVSALRSYRPSGNRNALDQLVRIVFHQRAVFARAGLALVGIANHVLRFRNVFRDEAPLHARRESGAAASAQIGFLHFINHLLRRHFLDRFFERSIAVGLQVNVNRAGILQSKTAADDQLFEIVPLMDRTRSARHRLRLQSGLQILENQIHTLGSQVLIKIVIHLGGRRARACADTLDLFKRKRARRSRFPVPDLEPRLEVIENLVAAAQHAGNIRANLDVIFPDRLAAQHRVIQKRFRNLNDV